MCFLPLLLSLEYSPPVFFHEDDAQGEWTRVESEYKQGRVLLLPTCVSESHNKGEVGRTEGDSEAGELVSLCPVSEMAHY